VKHHLMILALLPPPTSNLLLVLVIRPHDKGHVSTSPRSKWINL